MTLNLLAVVHHLFKVCVVQVLSPSFIRFIPLQNTFELGLRHLLLSKPVRVVVTEQNCRVSLWQQRSCLTSDAAVCIASFTDSLVMKHGHFDCSICF